MNPLVVAALDEEVAYVPPGVEVAVTGVGKARAAAALSRRLASGSPPEVVLNVGTAGAVDGMVTGLVEVTWVTQHDFPYEAIEQLMGRPMERGYALAGVPQLQHVMPAGGTALATGDVFVSDADHARRLSSQGIHLVDMEGFAFAAVCAEFGVPFRCVKVVSDLADEDAGASWLDTIDACAHSLGRWIADAP